MIFRPCPNFDGYSSTACGIIRRDAYERVTKTGKKSVLQAKVLKRVGKTGSHVMIDNCKTQWERLQRDAWGDEAFDRPKSDCPRGRVITLREWIAECHPDG